jgi:hypothetical protein
LTIPEIIPAARGCDDGMIACCGAELRNWHNSDLRRCPFFPLSGGIADIKRA